MSLIGPNEEDTKKLHSEINQIINQRFTLTTFAVTVFGIITSWLLSKDPTPQFAMWVIFLLIALLSIIFLFHYRLRAASKTLSTYLIVTGASGWEQDWINCRDKKPYWGYTRAEGIIFLVLGILATLMPLFVSFLFDLKLNYLLITVVTLFGLIYCLFVVIICFLNWFDNENKVKKRWEEIANRNKPEF